MAQELKRIEAEKKIETEKKKESLIAKKIEEKIQQEKKREREERESGASQKNMLGVVCISKKKSRFSIMYSLRCYC